MAMVRIMVHIFHFGTSNLGQVLSEDDAVTTAHKMFI